MVRAISLFSGIEALSVAARGLDWQVVAFAEIEPFPCALLDYYYKCGKPLRLPDPAEARTAKKAKQIRSLHRSIARIEWIGGGEATNFGDAAQLSGTELPEADWIVAGPPCPDYSVAGKRAGIHGEHGNMTLELLRIYNEYHACRPHTSTHLLFENVPGLLSDRGNAFGRILAELAGEDTALEPAGPRWTHAGFVSG
ncbi:MAG: DNA cytosine methyltransferase, partial [Desulfovibrio sp.]|nr:DNA cytosine methyltransferase [Desulfovibrio sp.]